MPGCSWFALVLRRADDERQTATVQSRVAALQQILNVTPYPGRAMPNYGDSAYWEQRYEQERMEHGHRYTYDWYFPWSTMETYIGNFCSESKSERVLIAGCGNSLWPEQMYESGYHNITCVDWSREVIGTMSTRNRSKQGMVYEHADVRSAQRR